MVLEKDLRVVSEGALFSAAVGPGEHALAVHLVEDPRAVVLVLGPPAVHALPVSLSIEPFPLKVNFGLRCRYRRS